MNEVWIAYTDGYYAPWGSHYAKEEDAIKIEGIYATEIECLRDCVKYNWKCKSYKVSYGKC